MATSLNASLNVQLNPQSLNQASKQVSQALGRITGQASEFQKSLDASTARVFAFGATTAVLNGVTQSFKKLVATTIEVEKRLIEVNSIFQATEQSFNKFRNSIFRVAKETGQSFSTVADGAAELARQGLSAEETASRLKSALVLTRISGLDAEKSVKALTAAINGFQSAGLKHTEIVNKMVAVDTAFAVSAQDLAEAFSRAGSTAEDAGVSFDQLLALVTAVEQKTARGGAVIGNAFKSIFTRLSRGTTISELQELGVAIDASQTGVQKLQALSTAIEGIADPTVVSKIKELAGGVFQINVVSAALKDLSSETGIFKNAAQTAANATNEAFQKNAALGESLASNINALVVGLTSLAEKVGTITLGGPAIVIFTAAFAKITQLIGRFAVEGLKSLFTIGTQTEKIRSVESSIVQLLQRDETLRNAILNSTMSQSQKEQLVLNAIRQENALLERQAVIMRNIATTAHARGVRGTPAGGFRGRFNQGFRAEEAEARMLGAPAGVKGRMSKGTIGGRKFIMNNYETEIPNFAGRDSAVIPHYSRGFVPNYSRRNLQSIINNKSGRKSPEEVAAARLQLEAMDARAAGKTPPINVSPSPYGFLVPSMGAGASAASIKKGISKVGGHRYPYQLTSAIKPYAPMMRGESIDQAAEPYDSRLEKRIQDSVVKSATKYAELLVIPKGKNTANSSDISRRLSKGGQRGAHGAIRGAVGAAFEAAVFSALGLDEFKAAKGGADWDVRQLNKVGKGEVRQIFRSPESISFADMKVGATQDTVDSFVGKILRHNKSYADDMARHREAKKKQKAARRAAGFIPNYIGKGGGVPTSLMRVHKDDKGSPVAVTNLRDEPNGLQDAIKRERQGIGMNAGGFIPNYFGAGMKGGIMQVGQFATAKATSQVSKLGSAAKNATPKISGAGDKSAALMAGMFALQSVMGMLQSKTDQRLFQAREEEQVKMEEIKKSKKSVTEKMKDIRKLRDHVSAVEDSTRSLQSFSETMQIVMTTLMSMQMLNSLTGGGIGRVAGKAFNSRAMGRFGFGQVGKQRFKARMSGNAMGGKATDLTKVNRAVAIRGGTRFLGAAGTVIGGGMMVGDALSRQGTLRERQASMTRTGGGVGGGILGGATVGALGGGPIGAAIGAIVGAIGGGFFGHKIAEGIAEKDKQIVKDTEASNLRGLSEKGFEERANLVGQLRARGVSALDYDMASAEDQKKMLQLDETQEGVDNMHKAMDDYHTALDKLTDIQLGKGFNMTESGKKEEALKKAEAEMLKRRNILLGKTGESEKKNLAFLNELRIATKELADARSKLADRLKHTGLQTDEDVLNRAGKDLNTFNDLDAMSGVLKGTTHETAVKSMIGGGQALSEANLLAQQIKQAENILHVAERLGTNDTRSLDDPTGKGGGRTMQQLREVIATSGAELRDSVRKGAVFFKNTMHSIAQEQKKVQSQLNEVSLSIISKAQDVIKSFVAGEMPNLEMLGADTSVIGNLLTQFEASKKEGGEAMGARQLDVLRNMIAELDTSALGMSEADTIAAAMGRPVEKIAQLLNDLKLDTIMSPQEREAAASPDATPAQQAKLRIFEKIKQKSDEEIKQQQDLIEKKKGLSTAMQKVTEMYEALAELNVKDEDGQNIVTAMDEFADALTNAGTSLSGVGDFASNFVDSTLKTSELVTSVTKLNNEAIGAVKELTTEVGRLKKELGQIKSRYSGG
jgi:TP901 family phage tail tape measure protein